MMDTALASLLFLPFEKEHITYPTDDAHCLFWNTGYNFVFKDIAACDVIENYKYLSNSWIGKSNANLITPAQLSKEYDFIFLHLPQQKDYARAKIGQAIASLKTDGILVAMAANDAGGKNIDSWMKKTGLTPNVLSKSKCRIVWTKNTQVNQNIIEQYIEAAQPKLIDFEDYNFVSQAGIYGWNKIDVGSWTLIENLPDSISGDVADIGCGYGFIGDNLLSNFKKIKTLHMVDADYRAMQCAQENLKKHQGGAQINFDWIDVLSNEFTLKNLDYVVMNPPFHQGKNAQNSIGQNFITKAHQALKKQGCLYMVANAHLPYEKHLNYLFSSVEKLCESDGYKIFKAQK